MDAAQNEALLNLGGKAAGGIFLSVLFVHILDDFLFSALLALPSLENLLGLVGRTEDQLDAFSRVFTGALAACLAFLVTLLGLKLVAPHVSFAELLASIGLTLRTPKLLLIVNFVLGIALVLLFSKVLLVAFPPPDYAAPHPANVINAGTNFEKAVFVFTVIMLAPLSEELLFRGAMYSGMSRSWGKPVAAVLVSICFILIHPETISSGYWLTHLLLLVVACILILVREWTGSLLACTLFHSGFNFAVVFL